ncbi:MAG: adenylate/guanylate cyclase domain-containing protein [Rhodocyclales bacterium]|nr:adenylate/guanylate cyclase domain-containing protein [Rhodocyclales bacterium]
MSATVTTAFARHWPRVPWAGIGAAALALLIAATPAWRGVELSLYDLLLRHTAPNRVDLPVTIIGIDEESFATIGLAWPWPRSLHARVVDTLREAGAAVVVFDVVFAEPGAPLDDAAFATAIERFGAVVLAADVAYSETGSTRQWLRVDPLARFIEAGAVAGLASVELDRDGAMRRVPGAAESMWRQTLKAFDARYPGVVESHAAEANAHIRYLGPPHTFPYIPYHRLLDPDHKLSANWRDALRDNIVLIGRNLNASTEVGSAQTDMFHTPFFSDGRELMPGVEIQANLIASLIEGRAIREASRASTLATALLIALAAIAGMRRWRLLPATLLGAGLIAAALALQTLLFAHTSQWLPLGGAVLAVLLVYLSQGGQAYLVALRQRGEITRAFGMYLAPALVEQIAAHPEQLKLGGERRELTLLFTDLAGFTEIAESMEVEQVAALLNRHLSEMTAIVMAHGGTVDKFIGDAIMAFWNAPLEMPDPELRAVNAAIAMQARMRALHDETLARHGVALSMRIGVHRGPCIVGNLGGDNRFDFTAVGDAVNLASRLEGVNKVYGTTILLSETVAEAVSATTPLREIDTLRVKGKQQGIKVYTPCIDPALSHASAEALALYRAGDWTSARDAWRQAAAQWPDDPVAATFVARLEQMANNGWPLDWDGVTTLDSK